MLETSNKQLAFASGKSAYIGNAELESLNLEYGGKSIPVSDFILKSYLESYAFISRISTQESDANLLTKSGVYADNAFTNVPYPNGFLLVFEFSNGVLMQINSDYGIESNRLAFRTCWYGKWFNWKHATLTAS